MANRTISDLIATFSGYFKLAKDGVRLKNSGGNLAVRNNGDSADAEVTASKVNISGNDVVLNSDAAGSGADWNYTLRRPSSGMSAAVVLVLPPTDGSPGQFVQTDGDGNLVFADGGDTAPAWKIDETSLAFGSSSPVTMFTKAAGARSGIFRCIVTEAFDGTAPTVSIGIAGTTSKYVPATAIDLKTVGIYEFDMSAVAIEGSTEALIATFNADSSAAGAAILQYAHAIPT